jgi:hypothetical protein
LYVCHESLHRPQVSHLLPSFSTAALHPLIHRLLPCRQRNLEQLVQQAVASYEMHWLLLFQLACTCQQLQHKSRRKQQQQQQQQQQPFEQLFTALGLPASTQYSSYYEFKDNNARCVHVLLNAFVMHFDASGRAAAEQQQQQQQQPNPQCSDEQQSVLAAQLLQPLLLTLLQLCSELMPILSIMEQGVRLIGSRLDSCLMACTSTSATAAALASATEASSAAGATGVLAAPAQPTPAALAVGAETAYADLPRLLVQPLLHVLGPAVLKEVRRVEQGLNRGSVSSRIAAALPGRTAEDIASPAEGLLDAFGSLVLRILTEGKGQPVLLNLCSLLWVFVSTTNQHLRELILVSPA